MKLNLKPIINKINGQINFSLPKKLISKKLLEEITLGHKVKFDVDGWE